jgi:hypothetical protein
MAVRANAAVIRTAPTFVGAVSASSPSATVVAAVSATWIAHRTLAAIPARKSAGTAGNSLTWGATVVAPFEHPSA